MVYVSFYCQVACIPTAEKVKNVVNVLFNSKCFGMACLLIYFFFTALHCGLTVIFFFFFLVLLCRWCTCICKKVVCYLAGPPSTLPLSTQPSSGSSTLSKKRPPPPPPGHKRTLSDPPSPLPHGPQNKGPVPWGEFWNARQKGKGKPLLWYIYIYT